jgi:hypothetical protein
VVSWDPGDDDDGIEGVEVVDPDPTTGISGIKWDLEDDFDGNGNEDGDEDKFSFTLDAVFPVGTTDVGIKTGGQAGENQTATGLIAGPHCGAAPTEVELKFGNYEEEDTSIKMTGLTVEMVRRGVRLTWVTGTEVDSAGFNVYRATDAGGPYVQLNEALIVAEGDAVSGASYSFADTPGYGTFYYTVEDVDMSGASAVHGPVLVTVSSPFRRPLFRPNLPLEMIWR